MPGNVTWLLVTIRCLLLTPIDTVKCSKPILTVSVVYHCEHRDWLTMIYRNFFQILPVAILIQVGSLAFNSLKCNKDVFMSVF